MKNTIKTKKIICATLFTISTLIPLQKVEINRSPVKYLLSCNTHIQNLQIENLILVPAFPMELCSTE